MALLEEECDRIRQEETIRCQVIGEYRNKRHTKLLLFMIAWATVLASLAFVTNH